MLAALAGAWQRPQLGSQTWQGRVPYVQMALAEVHSPCLAGLTSLAHLLLAAAALAPVSMCLQSPLLQSHVQLLAPEQHSPLGSAALCRDLRAHGILDNLLLGEELHPQTAPNKGEARTRASMDREADAKESGAQQDAGKQAGEAAAGQDGHPDKHLQAELGRQGSSDADGDGHGVGSGRSGDEASGSAGRSQPGNADSKEAAYLDRHAPHAPACMQLLAAVSAGGALHAAPVPCLTAWPAAQDG